MAASMMKADQAEAEAAAAVAVESRDRAQAEAVAIVDQAEAERAAFKKQAREWVNREKTALASKHEAADADRAAAAADLMTARTVLTG